MKNDLAVLSVRNYGVGIATEQQNMIFEPFYQIDKSRFRDSNHYGLGRISARPSSRPMMEISGWKAKKVRAACSFWKYR
ncbi:MAG: hypothetical protein ACJ0DH_10835 [bacterium]